MARAKQQWIEESGGFRIGESTAQFQERLRRIEKLKDDIAKGRASPATLEELERLRGTDEQDDSSA